ncbi:helix-turn-helix domain-containing protein [Metabacillus sp. YM-086]|uniref:helix-turn-helix domain-containing protein n=1 Tax=Metabacillus sp. YM-086 TaxID=3341729 RepID=UPI003A84586F
MEKLNYETIRKYQSFQTIEEMDQAVRGFLYKHKSELSEGTLEVLRVIWRHSVKVIGVSFAKYDYIAERVGVSRRTVIRAVNTLEEKGIVKKVATKRMNGSQGVNLLIIQSFASVESMQAPVSPQDVTAPVTPNKTENKLSSLCENKKNNKNIIQQQTSSQDEINVLPNSIPKEFVQVVKPYFNAIEIYKLWNSVMVAYNKMNFHQEIEFLVDHVIEAFKQTLFAQKLGKIHKSFEGYFYTVLYQLFVDESRKEYRARVGLYDFIEGEMRFN